jgi:hypothetical protein
MRRWVFSLKICSERTLVSTLNEYIIRFYNNQGLDMNKLVFHLKLCSEGTLLSTFNE